MYPETAHYVANYILSRPRLGLYEPLYVSRYRSPDLPSFRTPHQGKGGYWSSPQRYHPSGSVWQNLRRHHLVVPGNTGFSDVTSTKAAGSCRLRHTLVWKYRWLQLREMMKSCSCSVKARSLLSDDDLEQLLNHVMSFRGLLHSLKRLTNEGRHSDKLRSDQAETPHDHAEFHREISPQGLKSSRALAKNTFASQGKALSR
ncbi:hypothetical protein KOW79_002878 [Hemibagrus wyckioides]|uniref:Uncharacterized protein n=1 Tax=Hemibagrus wyckioides TaxID=337641 RepID=A0A9D3P5I1_9TELE|nr:hypothetical protein KOW79_002878 [Hemibagrus wyckioides]